MYCMLFCKQLEKQVISVTVTMQLYKSFIFWVMQDGFLLTLFSNTLDPHSVLATSLGYGMEGRMLDVGSEDIYMRMNQYHNEYNHLMLEFVASLHN